MRLLFFLYKMATGNPSLNFSIIIWGEVIFLLVSPTAIFIFIRLNSLLPFRFSSTLMITRILFLSTDSTLPKTTLVAASSTSWMIYSLSIIPNSMLLFKRRKIIHAENIMMYWDIVLFIFCHPSVFSLAPIIPYHHRSDVKKIFPFYYFP